MTMRTLIAIPCMDMVHTIFMKAMLSLERVGDVQYGLSCSSLVYDARNGLAKKAVDEGFDRILWLDSDMDFQPDLMKCLSADLDEGRDFVAGLYFKRKAPITPVVYSEVGYWKDEDNVIPFAMPYHDYPKDSVFEIKGTGFGACMMTTEMVKKVMEQGGMPFSPMIGLGEDLSFCVRALQAGYKLYCDSRIKLGHVGVGVITEDTYITTGGEKDAGKSEEGAPDSNRCV